jgi:hypothetical protein
MDTQKSAPRFGGDDPTRLLGDCIPTFSGNSGGLSITGLRKVLSLSASPLFFTMAILTAVYSSGLDALCSGSTDAIIPLGMGTMYVLMGVFHLGPWLSMLENSKMAVQKNET